ncbi:MAG: NAD(P)H-dependent oxidoreductase subunit E [Planctomycetota bacterium]
MRGSLYESVARVLTAAAVVAVLGVVGLLLTDALVARWQLAGDKARVEELLELGQKDAAYAAALHDQFDRQRDASLDRVHRLGIAVWILVVSGAVIVAGVKSLMVLRGRALKLPKCLQRSPVDGGENGMVGAGHVCACAQMVEEEDLGAVAGIVARIGREREAAIPILQAIQEHYRYLPTAALKRVCELTEITAAQLQGVASFYKQFRRTPVGEHLVKVCHGTACHVAGAPRITDELKRRLNIPGGADTDAARKYTVEQVACLGCCTLAPVVQIDSVTHGHLSPDTALEVVAQVDQERESVAVYAAVGLGDGVEAVGEIRLGLGSCCVANGGMVVYDALKRALAESRVNATVKRVGCVGMCYQTPLLEVDVSGRVARYGRVRPEHVAAIVRRHFRANGLGPRLRNALVEAVDQLRDGQARQVVTRHNLEPRDPHIADFLGPQKHIATEHCGDLDPTDLDEYLRYDGFRALAQCRDDLTPDEVIERIGQSGLRGRGGAGYVTAEKWRKVRQAAGTRKYIICNGDEGDPGAFMDRMLMESYPHRVIEGLAIAAYAVGATEGIFYIRREYPLAAQRIREALQHCEQRGLLGGDRLKLRIVEGAGAFVCGEESALIASLEGNRGMPSLRPPYPAECGLWGHPTLVNNVETYALVPWIMRHGPQAFAELGTATSKGTKVFALTGKVKRGGLIEVPMGVTIKAIVEEIGGGIKDDPATGRPRQFKAVQIGGPSGGCVPASLADTPVDYEALAQVGAIMGSGGLVVLDDSDCMVDIARYFLAFTQDQSCGQCTPCRVGTRRMLDILERLCAGQARTDDLERLEHLAHMVGQSSLCGLGRTAPNPVLTTLRYYRDEYEAHLEGRCPAGRCPALITYEITEACIGCTICAQHCPVEAIEMKPYERHEIDTEKCTRCDVCRAKCPENAIEIR